MSSRDHRFAEMLLRDHGIRKGAGTSPHGGGWTLFPDGRFIAYHPNGAIASQGTIKNGVEDGPWRECYDNGQIAAEGFYREGRLCGTWHYWDSEGVETREHYPTPFNSVPPARGGTVRAHKRQPAWESRPSASRQHEPVL